MANDSHSRSARRRKPGAPTKYKPKYARDLIDHMAEGLSFASFAAVVDVSRETLYEWTRVHPEFSDAKERGASASLLFWEKMGRAGTAGGIKGFNAFSWMLNMRNRFPSWTEKGQPVDTGRQLVLAYPTPALEPTTIEAETVGDDDGQEEGRQQAARGDDGGEA